jgi:hypothetical protein
MSQPQSNTPEPPAIAVSPKIAWHMIGCSPAYGYGLLKTGQIESFTLGKARRILVASIHEFVARRLAAGAAGEPRNQPHKPALAARLAKRAAREATLRHKRAQAGPPLPIPLPVPSRPTDPSRTVE